MESRCVQFIVLPQTPTSPVDLGGVCHQRLILRSAEAAPQACNEVVKELIRLPVQWKLSL